MGDVENERDKGGKIKKGYMYKVLVFCNWFRWQAQSGMVGSETTQNVDDFRILERQKIAEDILNGNMSAKHITYDVFHKNYSINEWDYYDDFDKLKRLAKEFTF